MIDYLFLKKFMTNFDWIMFLKSWLKSSLSTSESLFDMSLTMLLFLFDCSLQLFEDFVFTFGFAFYKLSLIFLSLYKDAEQQSVSLLTELFLDEDGSSDFKYSISLFVSGFLFSSVLLCSSLNVNVEEKKLSSIKASSFLSLKILVIWKHSFLIPPKLNFRLSGL